MAGETIFQNWIFTNFILPFLLIFVLLYAILEKTKLLGENKHSVNAIISFVVGIIFTSFISSTITVQRMVVFLAVALVVLFVILVLWGFIWGGEKGFELTKWMKYSLAAIAGLAFIVAVLWATGVLPNLSTILFKQSWSNAFWTNFLFVAVVVVAIFMIIRSSTKKS